MNRVLLGDPVGCGESVGRESFYTATLMEGLDNG